MNSTKTALPMVKHMTHNYFRRNEAEEFKFYRIPKVLFTDPQYSGISAEAKVLYGLLLDRMSLSIKNNWTDYEGRVYIIFTIQDIMAAMNCKDQKVGKLLNELERKADLIERKRQGLGKPNLIYVKNFIEDSYSQIQKSENHDSGSDNQIQISENHDSDQVNITEQESLNSRCNYTDSNNTEYNDMNNSFTHSDNNGMSEENTEEGLYNSVVEELEEHHAIPYQYAQEPSKMACAIRYVTEYEARCNAPFVTATGAVDESRMDAFKFCVKCLIEMACDNKPANYRGAKISYAKVIDQINKNSDNCAEGGLYEFMEQTINDLLHAYHTTKITDIGKYTKSLIWSSFATYKVKLDALCCM